MSSDIIRVSIVRDDPYCPAMARLEFTPMPINFAFRSYDALGPRPIKLDELERQMFEDVMNLIRREIKGAFVELRDKEESKRLTAAKAEGE